MARPCAAGLGEKRGRRMFQIRWIWRNMDRKYRVGVIAALLISVVTSVMLFDQSGADGPAHRPGDYRGEYRAAPPAAHHHAGGQGPAGRLAVSDDRVLGKGFSERGVQPAPAAFRGAAVPGNALFRPQPHRRPDDPPLRRPGLVPAFRLLPRLYGGGLLGDVPVHPAFFFSL